MRRTGTIIFSESDDENSVCWPPIVSVLRNKRLNSVAYCSHMGWVGVGRTQGDSSGARQRGDICATGGEQHSHTGRETTHSCTQHAEGWLKKTPEKRKKERKKERKKKT